MNIIKSFLMIAVMAYATSATATTLDFEGFLAGQIINDEYFSLFGVTVSAIGVGSSPDAAVVFDSNNPTGGDNDLGAPFSPGAGNTLGEITPGNLLILHETNNCVGDFCPNPDDQGARLAGTFRFDFMNPVLVGSLDFFDIEGAEIGDVVLYDAANAVLATFAIPSTGGDNLWQRLFMNVSGVSAMEINMGGSGAIDNLEFTVVPVPGALLLMLGALAPMGFFRRKS